MEKRARTSGHDLLPELEQGGLERGLIQGPTEQHSLGLGGTDSGAAECSEGEGEGGEGASGRVEQAAEGGVGQGVAVAVADRGAVGPVWGERGRGGRLVG